MPGKSGHGEQAMGLWNCSSVVKDKRTACPEHQGSGRWGAERAGGTCQRVCHWTGIQANGDRAPCARCPLKPRSLVEAPCLIKLSLSLAMSLLIESKRDRGMKVTGTTDPCNRPPRCQWSPWVFNASQLPFGCPAQPLPGLTRRRGHCLQPWLN